MHQLKHHAPRWQSTRSRSGYARASAEAPCYELVVNNRGWPHGRINPREPQGSVFSLIATLSLQESRARALGTGGDARVTPSVRHPARSLGPGHRAPLLSGTSARTDMEVCSHVQGDS